MKQFYSIVKMYTEKIPSAELDQKILAQSSQYFSKKSLPKKSFSTNWKIANFAVLASVVIMIVINKWPSPQPSSPIMISDAPEMILNYNEIELMADASSLTDSDWEKINYNGKR